MASLSVCACVSVRARSVLTLPRLSASPAGGERTTPDSSVPYLSLLRKSRGHAALALIKLVWRCVLHARDVAWGEKVGRLWGIWGISGDSPCLVVV